jgi:hypothetical protein
MLFNPEYDHRFVELEEQLDRADAVTSELTSDVMAVVCGRVRALGSAAKVKIDRLIEAGAWTDLALALLELEFPQWKLRRLVYDEGEWLCSLSKLPALALAYDEVAEARHEVLPLAILIALLQVRRTSAATAAGVNTVPRVGPMSGYAVCCDNFS